MKEAIPVSEWEYSAREAKEIHWAGHRCFMCNTYFPFAELKKFNPKERCPKCFFVERQDAIQVTSFGAKNG